MRRIAAGTLAVVVVMVVAVLMRPGIVSAQEAGAIAGVVKDGTGVALSGVAVRVSSAELVARVRSAVTDASGRYRVADLPVGVYSVAFSLNRFSPAVRVGVEVAAGVTIAVDASLRPLDGPRAVPTVLTPGGPLPASSMRPYLRCGLTIVPADPKVDPKLRVPFGRGAGPRSAGAVTEFAGRTIAPTVCGGR